MAMAKDCVKPVSFLVAVMAMSFGVMPAVAARTSPHTDADPSSYAAVPEMLSTCSEEGDEMALVQTSQDMGRRTRRMSGEGHQSPDGSTTACPTCQTIADQTTPPPPPSSCPCMGLDLPGTSLLARQLPKGPSSEKTWNYSAKAGSTCGAWDLHQHPACNATAGSDMPSWCSRRWCYADPAECSGQQVGLAGRLGAAAAAGGAATGSLAATGTLTGALTTSLSAPSRYLPEAHFQGRKLHYSYAACGEEDVFTSWQPQGKITCRTLQSEDACWAQDHCAWAPRFHGCVRSALMTALVSVETQAAQETSRLGAEGCRCVGLSSVNGSMWTGSSSGAAGGKPKHAQQVPAELGSTCKAWDSMGVHSDCSGNPSPFWCRQSWCYVDPTNCDAALPAPQKSTYLAAARIHGLPLFYSYATCGETDTFSQAVNKAACSNYMSRYQCGSQSHCAWTSSRGCLHLELVGDNDTVADEVALLQNSRSIQQAAATQPSVWSESGRPAIETKEGNDKVVQWVLLAVTVLAFFFVAGVPLALSFWPGIGTRGDWAFLVHHIAGKSIMSREAVKGAADGEDI